VNKLLIEFLTEEEAGTAVKYAKEVNEKYYY